MKTMLCRAFRLIVPVVILSAAAPAYALRCGNDLVSEGDRSSEVRRLCGDPEQIEEREKQVTRGVIDPLTGGYVEITETIEITEWTYNFGPRRLMRRLRFENGQLVDIDSLGFGY